MMIDNGRQLLKLGFELNPSRNLGHALFVKLLPMIESNALGNAVSCGVALVATEVLLVGVACSLLDVDVGFGRSMSEEWG